jgi:protein tyrosine phosphatase
LLFSDKLLIIFTLAQEFNMWIKCALFLILSISSLYANPAVKTQIENRWQAFQTDREFREFTPGRSDAELKAEFEKIEKIRRRIWKTAGYERAEHLIAEDLVRCVECTAFAFNNTVPTFNASTIYLGDQAYIACEGPRSKDVPNFFNLLATQKVTHLVRLTSSHEGWRKKCHPYWEGWITEYPDSTYLTVPTATKMHYLRAFQMDYWRDNHGVDPDELLALVLQIRDELKGLPSLLAVHCSAGVGRTGTFLAALAIVDAIDKELPFSIEEIVYRLSLQRVHTVAKFSQYITLHRLAEAYTQTALEIGKEK